MSDVKWRNIETDKPADEQRCLTKMKHGMIEGDYDAEAETFHGYYWHDMSWYASFWVPVEEVQP